jgi:hypothetical protein
MLCMAMRNCVRMCACYSKAVQDIMYGYAELCAQLRML